MEAREDFNKWCSQWDKAQEEWAKEAPPPAKADTEDNGSFFGLQSSKDNHFCDGDAQNWHDVYKRTAELFDPESPQMITEKQEPKDGFGKDLADKLGQDVKFYPNPIHFASVGKDQELRVAKNWTAGEQLSELARMKALLYSLESDFLNADCLGEKTDELKKKIGAIQEKCEKLSNGLIPDPKTDVT